MGSSERTTLAALVASRISDIASTVPAVREHGTMIELHPVNRFFMERYGALEGLVYYNLLALPAVIVGTHVLERLFPEHVSKRSVYLASGLGFSLIALANQYL